jgi:hypothetical protein
MRFCPGPECPHYSKATKYERACYYEPQCWRGFLDAIIFTLGLRFGRRRGDTETHTSADMGGEGKIRGDKG